MRAVSDKPLPEAFSARQRSLFARGSAEGNCLQIMRIKPEIVVKIDVMNTGPGPGDLTHQC